MRRLVQGNEAMFFGAVRAGAEFFAGYPITPSSEILMLAAEHANRHPKFKFVQSEDEISAGNAIMGASLAGAKSFTATSGPGFSLMQEAIGYGHQAEIPTVIINVQRVAPGTGMPTMPAQQDIMQSRFGSSGDYYPFVFYPNSVAECYKYTMVSFNAAEESESPVVLLSDAYLGHLNEVVDFHCIKLPRAVRRKRAPLGTGQRLFTGLVHDEQGRPRTADAETCKRWHVRVSDLHTKVSNRYIDFEFQPNLSSDTLIISYGIVSRVLQPLSSQFALFRPIRMFPLLTDEIRRCANDYRNIVVMEANDGQYATIIESVLKRDVHRVPLFGGRINLASARAGLRKALGRMIE
ncbi:MAG: 2-oxoacid:acceptor oxidoreductase subunit alpha [Chloroflexota bacterium]|nr:2-oxoacid:acceptor oxidoreductase subunit alpha [Chloroflexota bacterium]